MPQMPLAAFRPSQARSDAPVVERMRAAGAIAIGRTNLPDMALRMHTDSSLHGLTRTPWNSERTCGGSSGGEAVALATGILTRAVINRQAVAERNEPRREMFMG